jgi:hypothetical protein
MSAKASISPLSEPSREARKAEPVGAALKCPDIFAAAASGRSLVNGLNGATGVSLVTPSATLPSVIVGSLVRVEVQRPNPNRTAHEFAVYIASNAGSLINYGERFRAGERISSCLAESTVNAVISKRFAKHQRMQWTKRGAHLLLVG